MSNPRNPTDRGSDRRGIDRLAADLGCIPADADQVLRDIAECESVIRSYVPESQDDLEPEPFDEATGPMPNAHVAEPFRSILNATLSPRDADGRDAAPSRGLPKLEPITNRCREIPIRCTDPDCPGFMEPYPASDNGLSGRDFREIPPGVCCDVCDKCIEDEDWAERQRRARKWGVA